MPKPPPEPKLARLRRERDDAKAYRDRCDLGDHMTGAQTARYLDAVRVYECKERRYQAAFARLDRAAAKARGR